MERFRIGDRWYTEAEIIAEQDRLIDEQFGPEPASEPVGPPRRDFARDRRKRIEAVRQEFLRQWVLFHKAMVSLAPHVRLSPPR
jgi:hypothetical protein